MSHIHQPAYPAGERGGIRATSFSKRGFTGTQKDALTADVVGRLLSYNADTGALTWKVSPRYGIEAGSVAGTRIKRGYIVVTLFGFRITAHRLAWLLHHGRWPEQVIDHINRDPSDNRIGNLRDVSQAVNLQNRATKAQQKQR